MGKQTNSNQVLQIQVTSINGSQSTIKFEKRKTGGFGVENEHKTNRSKLGERDFKLLKQNRVLLDLLYVQRFIGWLKDTYGINFLELTPQAWCEIISILLEQPKIMKERNGIVTYSYSNKTYAHAHFFDLLFGSFQDLDKEGTMRILRTLKDQSTKDYLRHNKKSLLLTKELEIDRSKMILLKELRRKTLDVSEIGKAILKLKEKYGSLQRVAQELGVAEDWLDYYVQHLTLKENSLIKKSN